VIAGLPRASTTVLAGLLAAVLIGCAPTAGNDAESGSAKVGPPDINGIWQAVGNAQWNLEGQTAFKGPATHLLGALGGVPASLNYVEGGVIPYTEAAQKQREQYRAEWNQWDPVVKCYIPGIPRQTYMPFPFHIVQSGAKIFIAYEYGSNSRIIHLDRPGTRAELPSWMGYSVGRWEGQTLVVEVTDQVAETWFDASGNFHSDALKVTERYTPMGENHMRYEATIEDPNVFTRPWTISMPLYRRVEQNAQILEYKCVPFAEDAVYGHLRMGEDRTKPTMKNLH
jgi:hypothetical protein